MVFEEFITNPLATLPMGYTEAKWVCESIIDEGAQDLVIGSRRNIWELTKLIMVPKRTHSCLDQGYAGSCWLP